MKQQKMKRVISVYNKKVKYDYEKIDSYTAGLVLTGSEVKSIKINNFNLADSFCFFEHVELFSKFHISEYENSNITEEHFCLRNKKLLLNKKELKKLFKELTIKGLTIVPYHLFVNDKGLIKLEIWLAKGKRTYDKKNAIKEADLDRELQYKY